MNTSPGVCLVSKTNHRIPNYYNFTKNETIELTSKNVIFNGGSFVKSKAAIDFVVLKRVQEWPRFLILSLSRPYKQNDANVNW